MSSLVTGSADARPAPGAVVTEAQRLLDHGAIEEATALVAAMTSAVPDSERELWQGLALLVEGLTQVARHDPVASGSLRRGADLLGGFESDPPHALDVAGLVGWAEHLIAELATRTSAVPPVPRLRIP